MGSATNVLLWHTINTKNQLRAERFYVAYLRSLVGHRDYLLWVLLNIKQARNLHTDDLSLPTPPVNQIPTGPHLQEQSDTTTTKMQ